jgi:serine/threonine protein phosphatase PrpC
MTRTGKTQVEQKKCTTMKSVTLYKPNTNKYNIKVHRVLSEETKKNLQFTNQSLETQQAGQDAILLIKDLENNPNQALLAVADGHGVLGHIHSYIAIRLLAKKMIYLLPIFKRHLSSPLTDDKKQILCQNLVEYAYLKIQEQMIPGPHCHFTELDRDSGTTMALALVLTVGNNRYIISSNAGDSQIIWSSDPDKEPTQCSIDHNCDNIDAVRLYLQRLARERSKLDRSQHDYLKRHIDLQPKPIYYSRINCPGGPIWPMYTDSQGTPEPIKVFRYQDDIPILDKEGYEKISTYYPHGKQSRRYPQTYVREDGRTVTIPGHESDNWGSTLEGNTQTLNGFGDLYLGVHHSAEPHCSLKKINEQGKLLIASDGLTDLFYFKELMAWIWDNDESPNLDQRFYDYLFHEVAPRDDDYPSQNIMNITLPSWDDLSGIVSSLPDMKCVNC